MIFLCFWINEYSMMAESTWNIQVAGRYLEIDLNAF